MRDCQFIWNPFVVWIRQTKDERFDMNTAKTRMVSSSLVKINTTVGGRMIAGCLTGLAAAALIFAAPEVGIAGAIGGVAMGVVSAILVRPHV